MSARSVLMTVLLGACISVDGSSGPGPAPGNGSGAMPGSGSSSQSSSVGSGVLLALDSVATPPSVDYQAPSTGSFFFEVVVELDNLGGSALPTSASYFTALTDQQVAYTDAGPQPIDNPCGSDVTVEPAGHLSCDVSFEVLDGLWPTMLRYDDGHDHVASLGLPDSTAPSAACSEFQDWWDEGSNQSANCGACITAADGSASAPCTPVTNDYADSCSSCFNECFAGRLDLCTCTAMCDSDDCQARVESLYSCFVGQCAGSCP